MKKEQPRKDNPQHTRKRAEKIMRHEKKRKEGKKISQPRAGRRQVIERKEIVLPKEFNLTDNYEETASSIDEVRRINEDTEENKNVRYYINFNKIEKIGPSAALVLASEFHVSNIGRMYRPKWKKAGDDMWNEKIQSLLIEMGFHKLLKLSSKSNKKRREDKDLRFLEFSSGRVRSHENDSNTGEVLYEISQKINEEFAGRSFSREMLRKLGSGIYEAVLNTGHHAYGDEDKEKAISRWWISASLQESTKEIKVICYDRGLSIPATVPKFLKDLVDFEKLKALVLAKDDANLIKVAMTTDRSQIKKPGRGNGLLQLKEFIDESKKGDLVVLSRSGKVVYSKLSDKETKWKAERLPSPMLGTLIVWSIIQEQVEL